MTPTAMAALHRAGFITPRPWTEAEFADLLAQPGVLVESDADGFALLRVTLDEAELLTITVAPVVRGEGKAGALLGRALARAANGGARSCFLEVGADNAPARRLYDHAGFRQVGTRPRYYRAEDGTATDAIVMVCDLPISQPTARRRDTDARESY